MAEYIDKTILTENMKICLTDLCRQYGSSDLFVCGYRAALWAADAAPAADVVEVRHGEWIMKETLIRSPYAKNAYCSVCLEETSCAHNYCPNCGAANTERVRTMAEYLNRGDLIRLFEAKADMATWTPKAVFHAVCKMIALLPAADVEEVRHGEWIAKKHRYFPENRLLEEMCCSVCEENALYNEVEGYVLTRYCPHCGAKMDGGGDGNDRP